MIANLPKWYRLATIESIGEETLEKRSIAIDAILTTNSLPFLLDCIRFYLKKPIKDREFSAQFFTAFNAADSMYLDDTSDLEKQVLSGAIISEAITRNGEHSLVVATVLSAAIFGMEAKSILNIDIVQTALDYLEHKASSIRQSPLAVVTPPKYPVLSADAQTVETLTTHLKGLSTYIKALAGNIDKQNQAFHEKLNIVEEESNIHWWLFRSYSNKKNLPVASLNPTEAPFILALELGELYKNLPIPNNAEAFLNKILIDVPNKAESISVKEAVETLTSSLSNEINESVFEKYGNLAPLHFGFSKLNESGGDSAWTAVFKTQTGISSDITSSPLKMALQLLTEVLFNDL